MISQTRHSTDGASIIGDYFEPWRRKIGLLTLGLACVFVAGWVRSLAWIDEIYIPVQRGTLAYAGSMTGGLNFAWTTFTGDSEWKSIQFQSTPIPVEGLALGWSIPECEWRCDWAGFCFVTSRYPKHRGIDFAIPYYSIVMPLTLLSAWLLLSKPGKPKTIAQIS